MNNAREINIFLDYSLVNNSYTQYTSKLNIYEHVFVIEKRILSYNNYVHVAECMEYNNNETENKVFL